MLWDSSHGVLVPLEQGSTLLLPLTLITFLKAHIEMWPQGRLGFVVNGGGVAWETRPWSVGSLVTFDSV